MNTGPLNFWIPEIGFNLKQCATDPHCRKINFTSNFQSFGKQLASEFTHDEVKSIKKPTDEK